MPSVVNFLVTIVTALMSLWIVLSRRFFRYFNNDLNEDIRSSWTIFADILVELIQDHRDSVVNSLAGIQTTRFIDKFALPINTWRVQIKKVSFKGRDGHVLKGEWLIPKNETDSKKAILYFHGGGFCLCSINTHRRLASQIALASNTRLFIFEYRRTPEFVYPAQVHDGIDAFEFICSQGHKPQDTVFIGDSAGGHLAVSVPMHILRTTDQRGDSFLPAAVGTMSPWVDLTNTSESYIRNFSTDFLPSRESMSFHSKIYAVDNNMSDWRISPVFGDFSGFPTIYIQASETEQMIDDSILLAKNARRSGVHVKFDTWKNQPHVFQAFGGKVADEAVTKMGNWVKSQFENSENYEEEIPLKFKSRNNLNGFSQSLDSMKSSLSIDAKYSL